MVLSMEGPVAVLQSRMARMAERAARDEHNAAVSRAAVAEAEALALRAELGAAKAALREASAERESAQRLLADALEISGTNEARRAGTDAYGGVEALRGELTETRAQLSSVRANFGLLTQHSRGLEAANRSLGAMAARQRAALEEGAATHAVTAAELREQLAAGAAAAQVAMRERCALLKHVARLERAVQEARRDAASAAVQDEGAAARAGDGEGGDGGGTMQRRATGALEADLRVVGSYALQLEAELRARNEQHERLLRVETALLVSKRESIAWAGRHEEVTAELAAVVAARDALAASLEQHQAQVAFLEGTCAELRAALAATEATSAARAAEAAAERSDKERHAAESATHEEAAASLSVRLQAELGTTARLEQQLEAERTARAEAERALRAELASTASAAADAAAAFAAEKAAAPAKAREARAEAGRKLTALLRASAMEYDAMEKRVRDAGAVKEAADRRGWSRLRQQVEIGIKQERDKMGRKLKKQEEVIDRLFQEAELRQVRMRELEQQSVMDEEAEFLIDTKALYARGAKRGAKQALAESAGHTKLMAASEEKARKVAAHRQSVLELQSLADGHAASEKLSLSMSRQGSSKSKLFQKGASRVDLTRISESPEKGQ